MRQITSHYSGRKKVSLAVFCLISLLGIYSLAKSLVSFFGVDERVVKAQQEVASLRQEYEELQGVADEVASGKKEEKYIRDKLGLVKPGEVVVIIPDELLAERRTQDKIVEEKPELEKQIWQQWLAVVF